MTDAVCAVVVTHRRPDELAKSLNALSTQTRAPDHLVVIDNDNDPHVAELVASQPIPTTYLGSRRNLGGAGGFALGMLHALAQGADWVWLADDDGRHRGRGSRLRGRGRGAACARGPGGAPRRLVADRSVKRRLVGAARLGADRERR